jgi:hypothetical protein
VIECQEGDRLKQACLDAAIKVTEAGDGIDTTSAKWKDATSKARVVSKAALEALKRHRREHGC